MVVWCNLNKREVLSEADCYYCEDRIGKMNYCQYLMKTKDAPKKDYDEYNKKHLEYNERKNHESRNIKKNDR